MSHERVYRIESSGAEPLAPVSFAEAGLRERQDLQEWVIAHPEILGEDIRIVAFEFDRWEDADGGRQRDRLDVLGLDQSGCLVLAELKRDAAPDTVEMQAIKYAAMASRFTEEKLVAWHAAMLGRLENRPVSEEEAREALTDHAGELDVEQLRRPRIVLVAGAFTRSTTAAVVWLTEMGLDITLQRVQAYRMGGDDVVITVSQLFPVPDVEEFTVSPMRMESTARRTSSTRSPSTVRRLVQSGALPDGTVLTLVPTTEVNAETREAIADWISDDPRRGRATWWNDPTKPMEWELDGNRYRPSRIVQQALREATGITRSPRGPAWWVTENGMSLTELAGDVENGAFDWTQLHRLLCGLPAGRWTTYGEVARFIGTAPQPLGGHFRTCTLCRNAYRVLDANGAVSSGFTWSDPQETRTQQEVLEAEGISFDGGRAAPSQRLQPSELESVWEAAQAALGE